jgi:NAD(P)-dependent dehydrogenase (short-subunit alcohol dehydrogenase family)
MCDRLANRNVVITGGTRGLGFLQVQSALECGANHVTFTSRPPSLGGNEEDAENARRTFESKYGRDRVAHVFSDVRIECAGDSDDGKCNGRVFDPDMRERLGLPRRVDSASLNAGVFGPGDESRRIDVITGEHWDNVVDTNCKGVWHGLKDFAKAQKKEPSQHPAVSVVKSIYGSAASLFGNAPYHASKFCVNGVVKQAAVEFARPERGLPRIQVNSVSPAFAKTPLTKGFWEIEGVRQEVANAHPTGTWVRGEDVAETVVWLMNPPRSMTGADVPVDNGVMAQSVPGWSVANKIRQMTGEPCCGSEE